jgi:hypothetical protein
VSRRALAGTARPGVVLVSDQLYQGIIRHGYGDVAPDSYYQVPISEKETSTTAWLRIPGDDQTAERVALQARQPSRPGQSGGVTLRAGGDQVIAGSTIVGRDMVARRGRRWFG